MSLYSDYLAETGQRGIVESDSGFATYQIAGVECYIVDIYIKPEHRKSGQASNLANQITEIAKAQGCKYLTGTTNTSFKDPTSSMKTLLSYGFRFLKQEPSLIWFVKEIT